MNAFIAGTDTNVGKTYITSLLLRSFRENGIKTFGYKPICCGDRRDAEILQADSGDATIDEVNPLWLKTAAAPWVAAQLENRTISPAPLIDGWKQACRKYPSVLVEGCGGWEVPITETYSMADLARDIGLPVILVVANRLGAINHSVLTANAIRASGLELTGIILNHLVDELDTASIANKKVIPQLCQAPLLAEVIHGQDWIDIDWPSSLQ